MHTFTYSLFSLRYSYRQVCLVLESRDPLIYHIQVMSLQTLEHKSRNRMLLQQLSTATESSHFSLCTHFHLASFLCFHFWSLLRNWLGSQLTPLQIRLCWLCKVNYHLSICFSASRFYCYCLPSCSPSFCGFVILERLCIIVLVGFQAGLRLDACVPFVFLTWKLMIYSLTSADREINTKKITQVCDNAKKISFSFFGGEGWKYSEAWEV